MHHNCFDQIMLFCAKWGNDVKKNIYQFHRISYTFTISSSIDETIMDFLSWVR
jgi:hypothetical protein